jgi:hypothetical protein
VAQAMAGPAIRGFRFSCYKQRGSEGKKGVAFRGIHNKMVSFTGHGGDRGEAYFACPDEAGPFRGIVVIHHMPGWDEWTTEVTHKFAHHGYAAIAPNLYFRTGDGALDERAMNSTATTAPATPSSPITARNTASNRRRTAGARCSPSWCEPSAPAARTCRNGREMMAEP